MQTVLTIVAFSCVSALDIPFGNFNNGQQTRYHAMASLIDEEMFPHNGYNLFQHNDMHGQMNTNGQDLQSYLDDLPMGTGLTGRNMHNNNFNGQDLQSYLDDLPPGQRMNGGGLRQFPDHVYENKFKFNRMGGHQSQFGTQNHKVVGDTMKATTRTINSFMEPFQRIRSMNNMNSNQFLGLSKATDLGSNINRITNHRESPEPTSFHHQIRPHATQMSKQRFAESTSALFREPKSANSRFPKHSTLNNVISQTVITEPSLSPMGLGAFLTKQNPIQKLLSPSKPSTTSTLQDNSATKTSVDNQSKLPIQKSLSAVSNTFRMGNNNQVKEFSPKTAKFQNKHIVANNSPIFTKMKTDSSLNQKTGLQKENILSNLNASNDKTRAAKTFTINKPIIRKIKNNIPTLETDTINTMKPIYRRIKSFSPSMVAAFKKFIMSKAKQQSQL